MEALFITLKNWRLAFTPVLLMASVDGILLNNVNYISEIKYE